MRTMIYWPGVPGQRRTIFGSEFERSDVRAFLARSHDHDRTEAMPRKRRRRAKPEAGIACCAPAFGRGEQRLHRALPVHAECRNADCAAQGFRRVLRRIEQGIDLGDRHALGAAGELLDPVAGADFAFLYDAAIKPGSMVRNQQCSNVRLVQPDSDPVARVAWLADLDNRAADFEAISNADLVIGETFHCEVLAEIPGTKSDRLR